MWVFLSKCYYNKEALVSWTVVRNFIYDCKIMNSVTFKWHLIAHNAWLRQILPKLQHTDTIEYIRAVGVSSKFDNFKLLCLNDFISFVEHYNDNVLKTKPTSLLMHWHTLKSSCFEKFYRALSASGWFAWETKVGETNVRFNLRGLQILLDSTYHSLKTFIENTEWKTS